MPGDFDIIVREKDSSAVTLICEVKLRADQLAAAELQLKRAMSKLSCPLGLLFTPEIIRIYVDRYTSDNPAESVALIGEFDSRPLLRYTYRPGTNPQVAGPEFETAVQRWLEGLSETFSSEAIPDERLAALLTTFVIPALATGRVSTAAPRYFA